MTDTIVAPPPVGEKLRQRVLSVLKKHPNGLDQAKLAYVVHRKLDEVRLVLSALSDDGDVILDRIDGHKKIAIWMLTDKGARGFGDPRYCTKQRKCLSCAEMFHSTGAGNRICPACKEKQERAEHRPHRP